MGLEVSVDHRSNECLGPIFDKILTDLVVPPETKVIRRTPGILVLKRVGDIVLVSRRKVQRGIVQMEVEKVQVAGLLTAFSCMLAQR